ncbi:cysteine--tRNA ligase [Bacteroidota bacterium]|nr:cysteine--tRNA ligase [Bacteroidota bacterium]
MSTLQFYNSLTRQKEQFASIISQKVGMYVCGPTVSGESHLGHARPFITFDIVYRYLKHLGYQVRYVRNITDAGHFEEEGRESEDKISKKAVLEKMEPMELVQKYTNLFHWAMRAFNNLEPSIEPTATGHIVEQIVMIEKIIQDGYAYVVNGSVYFDVEKYHKDFGAKGMQYGILSGRVLDEQLETTRALESQDEKRNKIDFALWKNAAPEHIMRWQSPWGVGFPGWHIECSAMSTKYLGEEFDIHGGGMDLQFPHHECEIAQSAVCNHKIPARYWLHNNMITINGKKMGKSYNNVIKLSELFSGNHEILTQGYSPMTVRFFILQTHYRSTLDFSNEALQAAEKGLKRIWEAFSYFRKIDFSQYNHDAVDKDLDARVGEILNGLESDMNDDLNTAKVMAGLFELVPIINSIKDGKIQATSLSSTSLQLMQVKFNVYLIDIFGLTDESKRDDDKLSAALQLIGEIRRDARSRKDFATSDKIRDQLLAAGIQLKDEKDGGMSWELI